MSDIHSCGYFCQIPACVLQQRDALRDKLQTSESNGPLAAAPQAVEAMSVRDWKTPTTFMQRFGDAMQALCHGHRPPREMMIAWLATDSEDNRLQAFACQYGFAWAQGIGLIDAACAAADQPTEGVDHKRRTPQPAPAAPTLGDMPEINLANYGDLEVERLQEWAFKAHDALASQPEPTMPGVRS